ncbi:hypothetical protein GMSM_30870 [Geomonas sp. Red276]
MRVLLVAKLSTSEFNASLKNGNAGKIINRILEDTKPEAVYFTAEEGCRTAMLIVNLDDPSSIPRLAEPWFLNFNASIEFKPVMTPDDLRKAALDDLGRKWG